MHLLVIGHTAHHRRDGHLVGWGPTVKEVSWLARAFDSVTHLACFHPGTAPQSSLRYESDRVDVVTVPAAGGLTMRAKARVVTAGSAYVSSILRNLPAADVVQVRCPGSLGMYGMLVVSLLGRCSHWIKYAGNWNDPMATSHRFQRRWLQAGLSRGPVTINGRWPGQPEHVFSFLNPSFSLAEVETARLTTEEKILAPPYRFVFVGRANNEKGMGNALKIVKQVSDQSGAAVSFDIVGDGDESRTFEKLSVDLGISRNSTFHGWLPHAKVLDLLKPAHFLLLPSASEGWPKVLSEAMLYGVVPLASAISAIPQILDETAAGLSFAPNELVAFADAILRLIDNPEEWKAYGRAGLSSAHLFTYERYLLALNDMLAQFYGSSPMNQKLMRELAEKLEAFHSQPDTVQASTDKSG